MNIHKERIQKLQDLMKNNNIDIYIILSADPHLSEYLPEYYKSKVFMSGFSGSVGTLVFTQTQSYLWVDGRYWLQAEKELEGSGMVLQKQDSSNTFLGWIKNNYSKKETLGVDFAILPLEILKELNKYINVINKDFINSLWEKRPNLPINKIYEHEEKYCSHTRKEKLQMIREQMSQLNAKAHLISSLDDIAWITNLRGSDVSYNPVFLSHLLILEDLVYLFVDTNKIETTLVEKLKQDGIELKPYECVQDELKKLHHINLLIEPAKMTALLINSLDQSVTIIENLNPSTNLKSQKNIKEIAFIEDAMIEDGVALCKFFSWLEEAIKNNEKISELDVDKEVTKFRSQSPYYISNSFATIAGFNSNSAFAHYKATDESYAYLQKDGLLLLDSGGQYKNGTTDITRVVPIGKMNAEQIHDYTLVLKAHIAMSRTIFPENIATPLLDAITRAPLWEEQLDYMHGTGHGVGYFLNVHEGPQVLSYFAPLLEKNKAKEGMVTSIEPGIYRPNKWGIRLENLVAHTKVQNQKNTEFGNFLYFKPLTLCPFEPSCIDLTLLDQKEKDWLNNYHQEVYQKLSPKLNDNTKALQWLTIRTQKL
ncbi:aminopeptidase P family protein [Campylobacter insulaenigrae]|uniref:aminopeptidase P family protein n=1 Tax=Campylobacter insulaenigrae TaxID=260714 RepID=UPI0021529197|nr:aminopeptidase P family protein [Campylobacter insulaenigrae]MCR6570323.1 aminopeptidase P family protein [Campylobacter insulaenigrae]